MPDFALVFTNSCTSPFICNTDTQFDAVLVTVHTTPGSPMVGGNGQESYSWSQTASTIASGIQHCGVRWQNSNTGKSFGVKILVPFQLFTIGSAPYYMTQTNDEGWEGDFTSEVFHFDSSKLGFNVTVHPVASHTTLSLQVTISDLS